MNLMMPKKRKFRKAFGGVSKGMSKSGNFLNWGDFGLKATSIGDVKARQIEAARSAIRRAMKRAGMLWIRIFPDVPRSKKPLEVRMGSGKGNVEFWAAPVRPGRILFEIAGVNEDIAMKALELAKSKLSIKSVAISRRSEL